jgi:peptidoglycan hydrolase-like amidase
VKRFSVRDHRGAALAVTVATTIAALTSCRSLPRSTPVVAPPSFSADTLVSAPAIRIGIVTDATTVSIGANSGVAVWIGPPGAASPRRVGLAVATFRSSGASAGGNRAYRAQVASLGDEIAARQLAERVGEAAGLPPTTTWNRDTATYQVRVGAFATRDEASALSRKLASGAFPGSFVVEEQSTSPGGTLRLLETGEDLAFATVVPAQAGEPLTVDSAPYRGLLQLRPADDGAIIVVNVLNLEDYLRGVVPNELSPEAFPQIEALKAQAVAARTYALRNRGQFRTRGYDLCATPACQVYRGRATEHPLSDQAVAETRGLVARYQGQPINALYTSTCGGHTEDGANMFEGTPTPYLKGVACLPERSATAELRSSAVIGAGVDEDGLGRDLALLVALGVVDAKLQAPGALTGAASDGELRDWTARLLTALRRKGCDSPVRGALNRRGAVFEHLVASLCWTERGQRLLAPGDTNYLLQVEDAATLVGPGERLAAAVLIQEGAVSPFPDNTLRGNQALARARAVRILARLVEKAGAPRLVSAEVQSLGPGELRIRQGAEAQTFLVDPAVRLFRSLEGVHVAVSELSLTAGDKVHLAADNGRVVFLEAEQSRLGPSADRTSRYFRWEVRLTPAEVEKAIARYGRVGRVRDIAAVRQGVSGRVVELAVTGSEGKLTLTGLKIRWALGLRENLFVIERERDDRGDVARFVFTGKGWGHGVGLCQVGAYGMAQAGATWTQILTHYYTGITLDRAY